MSVHALPLQPNYPWNTQGWGPVPCSQPGRYFTIASTHNPPLKTVMPDRPKRSPCAVSANVFPHCYPQIAGYAMSATLMSMSPTNNSTTRLELPQAGQKAAIPEPVWSSSWSFQMSVPPPHTRSLYATIPLPPDDPQEEAEVYSTNSEGRRCAQSLTSPSSFASPPPSLAPDVLHPPFTPKGASALSGHADLIQLHTSLQNAGISVSPLSVRSVDSDSLADLPRGRDAPATTPSVVDLTLEINSTGQRVRVKPSPFSSSLVVTVSDVLDVLETAFMTVNDTSHGRSRWKRKNRSGPLGEQISVILKSIQMWWVTSGGSNAGLCS